MSKLDIVRDFKKVFDERHESDTLPKTPYRKTKMFADRSMVLAVLPKKKWLADTLKELFDVNEMDIPKPMEWKPVSKKEQRAYFKLDYLKIVLQIAKNYEKVAITTKEDHPIRIETEDFTIIIAPVVEEEV